MTYRESNRMLLMSFVICGAAIVTATSVISAKFIADGRIAFAVNLVVAIIIAILFERYVEGKLNRSIDSLMEKIKRVRSGDLTQRFKEEQDDVLPYGLSFELGAMMDFFRGNIGDLWKTSSALIRQLEQLIAATREALDEFRAEVEHLAVVAASIETVKKEIADIGRAISELQVYAANDSTTLSQLHKSTESVSGSVEENRRILQTVDQRLRELDTLLPALRTMLDEINEMASASFFCGSALADIANEANLVKLNASIDTVQDQVTPENYRKLAEEVQTIVKKIADASQKSLHSSSSAEARTSELRSRYNAMRDVVKKSFSDIALADASLKKFADHFHTANTAYESAADHSATLQTSVMRADSTTGAFSSTVKNSIDKFDLLKSNAQITLMHFNELDSKISGIQDNLKKLEEFKKLFQIA